MKVLIKGAGDLASGVAHRLHGAGFSIIMTEIEKPTVIRRTVSFAQAVFDGETTIENIKGRRVNNLKEAYAAMERGEIPIIIDPEAKCQKELKAEIVVDAILAKRNINTSINDAKSVIALGPGFCGGKDCHGVIETKRGHNLGRIYYTGQAIADTGIPGDIGGESLNRLLKATAPGIFKPLKEIGDLVKKGDLIAYCGETPLKAKIDGCLRGILSEGLEVYENMKVGDIDPRGDRDYCFTVSDKARALGGAVLEAILFLKRQEGYIFAKRGV